MLNKMSSRADWSLRKAEHIIIPGALAGPYLVVSKHTCQYYRNAAEPVACSLG